MSSAASKQILKAAVLFAVTAVIAVSFFSRPLTLKTDIMALLPLTEENDIRQKAFNHISASSMGRINILFGADTQESAKNAGLAFLAGLDGGNYETTYLLDNESAFLEELSAYSYHLLSDEKRKLIEGGNTGEIALEALNMLFSPVKLPGSLTDDPFMLTQSWLADSKLLKSGFSPRSSVLSAGYNGKAYTYMSINLDSSDAFSPSRLSEIMEKLYLAKQKQEEAGISVNITGIPVHTYFASSGSMKEITFISIISFLVILAISISALRSIAGFITTLITVAAGFAVAFMVTNLVFEEIHILTVVFGTSLIGLSIDYCLHYFIERPCYPDSYTPLAKIRTAITISLTTSIIGFAVLLTSDMLLLKQMAVFSISGLLYAYLLIVCAYPLVFSRIKMHTPPEWMLRAENALSNLIPSFFTGYLPVKVIALAVIVAAGLFRLSVDDNIRYLYKPDKELLQAEELFAKVGRQDFSASFFFITGGSAEKILQNEEALSASLNEEISKGNISGYKGISQIVPSAARQEENYRFSAALFAAGIPVIQEYTGFDDSIIRLMERDFHRQDGKYLTVDKIFELQSSFSALWLEGSGSVILLEGVKDSAALGELQGENVYYMDKINDLSAALSSYRHKAAAVTLTAFMIILLLLLFRYGLKKGLTAASAPVLSIVSVLTAFGYFGVTLSFFHVIGLFLVLCFGMDYTVFQVETKGKLRFSGLAVMLSCITTLASFGLLAFTSFEVTKSLGVTLFAGILLSYLFSPIAKKAL